MSPSLTGGCGGMVEQGEDRLRTQSVLFALVQSARWTWTAMLEVLELGTVQSGALESLLEGARVALDHARVSTAATALLADRDRRQRSPAAPSADHGSGSAGHERGDRRPRRCDGWRRPLRQPARPPRRAAGAPGMGQLGAGAPRAHTRPQLEPPGPDAEQRGHGAGGQRRRRLAPRHDRRITVLATRLDYESRELALSLAPNDWWNERTREIMASAGTTRMPAPPPAAPRSS